MMPTENTQLIPANAHNNHNQSTTVSFAQGISLAKAFPDGMAKTYATFGPIAILYRQGLWLLVPVMLGGTISISDEAFSLLKKRYPDNELIKLMAVGTKATNQVLVGFFEDFGFTMAMMTTVAAHFGGVKYYDNAFAKCIAPMASAVPAALVRYFRLSHNKGQNNSIPLEITASAFRGANAPIFMMGLLQQQNVFSAQSNVPTIVIMLSATLGFFAGMLNKSHRKVSLVLNSLMETLLENPSLAVAFFAFPNDVFAAEHHHEIKESFFYSNVAISSAYLLMLTVFTLMVTRHEWHELQSAEEVPMVDIDEEQALRKPRGAGYFPQFFSDDTQARAPVDGTSASINAEL